MTEEPDALVIGSVRVTANDVSEMADGHAVVSVPRVDITHIELKRGIAAERPLLLFLFGLLLTLPGGYASRGLWSWLCFGGTLYVDVTLWLILLLPVGVWLACSAFRRRVFLHVHTLNDRRKILFRKNHSPAEILEYVKYVSDRFGYSIHNTMSEA